jgi:hypothetical protein
MAADQARQAAGHADFATSPGSLAGLRVVDVSGRLEGDLRAQGREIAVLETIDENAFRRDRPFTWSPRLHNGLVFASDFNSGLWVTRLVLPGPGSE